MGCCQLLEDSSYQDSVLLLKLIEQVSHCSASKQSDYQNGIFNLPPLLSTPPVVLLWQWAIDFYLVPSNSCRSVAHRLNFFDNDHSPSLPNTRFTALFQTLMWKELRLHWTGSLIFIKIFCYFIKKNIFHTKIFLLQPNRSSDMIPFLYFSNCTDTEQL